MTAGSAPSVSDLILFWRCRHLPAFCQSRDSDRSRPGCRSASCRGFGTDAAIRKTRSLAKGCRLRGHSGLRLGRLPEIRNIVYEEVEKAFQGQQTAQAALDSAVARGNRVLRDFERQNKA